jgi:hypothetical protein
LASQTKAKTPRKKGPSQRSRPRLAPERVRDGNDEQAHGESADQPLLRRSADDRGDPHQHGGEQRPADARGLHPLLAVEGQPAEGVEAQEKVEDGIPDPCQ